MLKSQILAIAILAVSSVCLAGPPASKPVGLRSQEVSPRTVLRSPVTESVGLRAALKKVSLPEGLAARVAEAGLTWDAATVRTIERMTANEKSLFEATTNNALTVIEAARVAGPLSREGALIVEAAHRALELAPSTYSGKFLEVTEQLKVQRNETTTLSNDVLAKTKIAAIQRALGTSLAEFIDCQ